MAVQLLSFRTAFRHQWHCVSILIAMPLDIYRTAKAILSQNLSFFPSTCPLSWSHPIVFQRIHASVFKGVWFILSIQPAHFDYLDANVDNQYQWVNTNVTFKFSILTF